MDLFWHTVPDSVLTRIVSGLSGRIAYSGGMKHILALSLALLIPAPLADGQPVAQPDYEIARDAVERGEILPLAQVMTLLQDSHPGRVVEVELEYSEGALVYEVELVTPDGRLIEVEVDAAKGTILAMDEEDDD